MSTSTRLATFVVVALALTGCGAGDSIVGTTWKGGNMMDSGVVFAFTTSDKCTIKTSFMGSGPCTYKMDRNQVLMNFSGQTYAFTVSGSQMTGNLLGAGVQLVRQ